MDERTEWIWPSDEMAPVYQQTLSANLILSLVALAIILTPMFSERPTTLVVLISLLGYAAVLVLALRLKIGWLLKKVQLTENWVLMNRLIARRGGAYVWNVVILLTLTAVFPAVTAFKVAYNTQMKLFLKHEQLTIAQALDRRNKHVIAQYSARQTSGEAFIKPVDSRQLNSRQVDSKQADPRQADSRQVDLSKFIARRLDDPLQLGHAFRPDVYTNFFYESRIGTWSEKGKQSPRGLIGFIDSLAPFFNESTVQTRSLLADSASDNSFEWGESADQLVFHQERKNETNPALQSDGLRIITPLKRFGPDVALRHFPNVASIAAWVMGFMIIIAIIFLVARFVVRKIFLLNVTRDLYPKTVGDLDGNQNLFLVNHLPTTSSNGFMHAPEHVVIDLGVEVSTNGWVDQIERRLREQSNINSIVIRHFEHGLNNQVINDQKLRLVESLLASHRPVVIMSALEPVAYFSPQGDGANNGDAPVNDNTGERWARAISRFKKLYTAPRRIGVRENALSELQAAFDSDKDISDEKRRLVLELAAQVYEECAAFPSLEDLSSDIIARLPFENRDWNQIKQEISDRAELYYRRIWENCSDGERLTLMHLAQDRLLSPNDPDIGPLLHKHLITFGPDLRPMNETFKEFLLAHTTNDNLRIKEIQAKNISQWEAFKIPLFVGFAAVLVFLVFTQKDLYNSSWTLVTVLTTGVPAIFKVISLFQTASSGGKLFNA
jgi:hypothetical protein